MGPDGRRPQGVCLWLPGRLSVVTWLVESDRAFKVWTARNAMRGGLILTIRFW